MSDAPTTPPSPETVNAALIGCTDGLCVRCDFVEEYYGWRCSKCGQFYPNTAPLENWLMNEPYENPD